jgi:hypothetical protein
MKSSATLDRKTLMAASICIGEHDSLLWIKIKRREVLHRNAESCSFQMAVAKCRGSGWVVTRVRDEPQSPWTS